MADEIEQLDFYNDSMVHLGSASRDEVHAKGYWHKTFHCWVIRQEAGRGYVLFQRRGPRKRAHPNKLDITAAGHLLAGETPLDGMRELSEELGIDVSVERLIFLGIRVAASVVGTDINREFNHVYLLPHDAPIRDYTLQRSEVTGLVQIEIEDGMRLCAGEKEGVHASGMQLDEQGDVEEISLEVGLSDLIPRRDNYYYKVFIMAQRYFSGVKYICI